MGEFDPVSWEEQARRDRNNIYIVIAKLRREGKLTKEEHHRIDQEKYTKKARVMLNEILVSKGFDAYEFEDIDLG